MEDNCRATGHSAQTRQSGSYAADRPASGRLVCRPGHRQAPKTKMESVAANKERSMAIINPSEVGVADARPLAVYGALDIAGYTAQ
jgi:hypothetical protein